MKLRKEYRDIVANVCDETAMTTVREMVGLAVERCQDLADNRPIVELTDDEVADAYYGTPGTPGLPAGFCAGLHAVEAAAHAKQREPEEIPFDYEKWNTGEWDAIEGDRTISTLIRSGHTYTMRRKK